MKAASSATKAAGFPWGGGGGGRGLACHFYPSAMRNSVIDLILLAE